MPELHVNIDHVATLRQARRTVEPSPLEAVKLIDKETKAAGITIHLREDRRHIQDVDVYEIDSYIRNSRLGLTFEMGATEEIRQVCLTTKAKLATLVPENRQEITTEGGLNLLARKDLKEFIKPIQDNGTKISFFINPDLDQVTAAKEFGADFVELHTGTYANLFLAFAEQKGYAPEQISNKNFNKLSKEQLSPAVQTEIERLRQAALAAQKIGLKTNLGHGLTVYNLLYLLDEIPNIQELHIGHSIIANAVFMGLKESILAFGKIFIHH
jgi:pyridoxine 5-phosphate synthase